MIGREAVFGVVGRNVFQDEFDGIEYRHLAKRGLIQMVTHALFEHAVINPAI